MVRERLHWEGRLLSRRWGRELSESLPTLLVRIRGLADRWDSDRWDSDRDSDRWSVGDQG